MFENWTDIITHKSLYQISDLGRVRNNKGQILSQTLDPKTNYLRVHLSKNGKTDWYLVHRLVAEAFIPNPEGLPNVNHIDEIKTNNRRTNLEWCTQQYNCNYGTRNKRIGNNNLNNKHLSKRVKCIETNITYPSASEAERQTGVFNTAIIQVCKGNCKTAGGYHWKYEKEE